jgi:hypothetical protein
MGTASHTSTHWKGDGTLYSRVETPKEQAGDNQDYVKTKRAVFFIRETGVISLRVKPLEETVYEILAVVTPFPQCAAQKWNWQIR